MTEADWLACEDPLPMLEFLRGRANDRKLRLFAVSCCRQVWHLLDDAHSRRVVEVVEEDADGRAAGREVRATNARSEDVFYQLRLGVSWSEGGRHYARMISRDKLEVSSSYACGGRGGRRRGPTGRAAAVPPAEADPVVVARDAAECTASAVGSLFPDKNGSAGGHARQQAAALRDIFGPLPFHPPTADPTWLTSTVLLLAKGIYEERAFDRMPILADALQDAGCDNDDILNHCRQPGEHVRGCWVVDLVLGKK